MLEAIRVHTQGWLAKLILAFITIPFALWGIDSYLHQAGSNVAVAKVDGDAVTVQQFGIALQNFRSQLQSDGKVDPALLDSPALKNTVLNKLVNEKLINREINKAGFMVSNDQLSKYIISLPEFQDKGKFSQDLYDKVLTENKLTASRFEANIRREILVDQASGGFTSLAYMNEPLTQNLLKTEHQAREVSVVELKASDYLSQVKVEDAEVKEYFEKHKDKFRAPEQVKIQFTLMSANTLIAGMKVSDEEISKFYNDNIGKFQGDEQRRASHILIAFGVNNKPEAKQAAKAKAQEVLAELKKHPNDFEQLAKKYSQDPVSAAKGGDLGSFGRGMMVKPFEDAVFAMKPGEVSDVVESEFGYHIIKLTEITGAAQTFDEAKAQIKADLLYEKALAKFSEQAENFNNMVYEQSDSLKPAADAFGLPLQTSEWMSRADGDKFFKTSKVMDKVFTDEVLKDHRNTEAIEVSPNNLMAARVVDYKPEAARSFDEVKAGITDFLKSQKAVALAQKAGQEALDALMKGQEVKSLEWIPPVVVQRNNSQGLTDLTMQNVFKINADKLPAYKGIASDNQGYLLIKVLSVKDGEADETDKKADVHKLQTALSKEYMSAYLASLKAKSKVTTNNALLNDATTK